MRYLSVFMLLYALVAANRAAGEDWAPALFAIKSHDFGTIAAGAKAEFAFVMKNDYAKEIPAPARPGRNVERVADLRSLARPTVFIARDTQIVWILASDFLQPLFVKLSLGIASQ